MVAVDIELPPHLSHSQSSNLVGEYCSAEEWRPAPGLDGYEVSSKGEVRSWRNTRGPRLSTPKRVGHRADRGYVTIRPTHGGPGIRVHRLVCEAFHGPAPFEGAVVRHLNDDPSDNRPENLAWGSMADNAEDRTRNGRSRSPRNGKLSPEQVREVRLRRAAGESGPSIAADFGLTSSAVYFIAKGVTYPWVK